MRSSLAPALIAALAVACSNGAGGKPSAGPGDPDDGGSAVTPRRLTLAEARAALWPRGGPGAARPLDGDARAALAALVGELWRGVPAGAPPPSVTDAARRAGVEVALWDVGGAVAWVVREPDGERRGTGVYLVRAGAPPAGRTVLVQAPHAWFDLGTAAIALGAFAGDGAPPALRGLFANSIHRDQQPDGTRDRARRGPADVAHAPDHPFQAATAAVAAAGPVLIAQLHGFDDGARDDVADAIVSAGDRAGSTPASTRVAEGLAAALGVRVARFPEDTRELGGVTNAQRRLVDEHPGTWFVHLELALPVRQRLRDDARAAVELARVLAAAAEATPR